MSGLTLLDWLSIVFFGAAWFGYERLVNRAALQRRNLNDLINAERHHWIQELAHVDNRIMDSILHVSLQSGTAFFTSTALLAIGGALALLRVTDNTLVVLTEFPLGRATSRGAWEFKASGLVVIFVYAYFKFAWSYRLFNHAAVLMGAVPRPGSRSGRDPLAAAHRAASMSVVATRHFNLGQQAFFFALAYLGWFVSGYILIILTMCVMVVMWRRQFASDALAAIADQVSQSKT